MEITTISPQMRLYYRRKEKGLCVECGKPLDTRTVKCKECTQKLNKSRLELVHWYKANGICPRCRKNNIIGDESECLECAAERYIRRMNKYYANPEEFKAKDRAEQKKIRAKRIEKGLCTKCGKTKADNGYKTCVKCRAKARNEKRKKPKNYKYEQKKEWVTNGKCWFCGEPIFNHSKLCETHYKKSLEYVKRSKEARHKNEQVRTEEIQRTDVASTNE